MNLQVWCGAGNHCWDVGLGRLRLDARQRNVRSFARVARFHYTSSSRGRDLLSLDAYVTAGHNRFAYSWISPMQIQLLSGCFVSTAAQASVASPSFLRNGNTAVVCTPLFTIAQASSCPAECNDLKAASATALQRAELDLDAAESATDYSRFCMQNCVHDSASTESLCTPASDAPARAPIVSPAALLNEGAEQMEKPATWLIFD